MTFESWQFGPSFGGGLSLPQAGSSAALTPVKVGNSKHAADCKCPARSMDQLCW
jgi:hypothetical protein